MIIIIITIETEEAEQKMQVHNTNDPIPLMKENLIILVSAYINNDKPDSQYWEL
jgi:hypothetical protein